MQTPQLNLWCTTASSSNPSCEAAPPNPLKRSHFVPYLPCNVEKFASLCCLGNVILQRLHLFYTVSAPEPWGIRCPRLKAQQSWDSWSLTVWPLRACSVCFPMKNKERCWAHLLSNNIQCNLPSTVHSTFYFLQMALVIYFTWASSVVPNFLLRDSDFC